VWEAERILRRHNSARRASALGLSTLAVVGVLAAGALLIRPETPQARSSVGAVLTSTNSSYCDEGITSTDGYTWGTTSNIIDQLRLPMRGKVMVVDTSHAVFTTHRVHIQLGPAMPCTAG
jgi:hypothetical protein